MKTILEITLELAREINRYPHLELVAFVDDDPDKQDRLIAGYRVLGTLEELAALAPSEQVRDTIACESSMPSEALH